MGYRYDIAKKEPATNACLLLMLYGANKDTRMAIRFIVEVAWAGANPVTNMFIKPLLRSWRTFWEP